MLVEGILFLAGVIVYACSTVATDRTGRYVFWSLIGFFALSYVANIYGPPPPSETALAYGGLLLWLIVPWGYWVDRHRKITLGHQA